ncbi:unnamed protein product [Zymoseptoria tritici ST99CH_3D1]|nr:unnamed protein product [Zymoseptoria tritici ST99CH_3D1]
MAKAWLKGRIQAFSDQESQSDPKATLNSALATKTQRDREVEHGSQLLKSEWPLLWADVDRLIETTSDKQEQRLIRQSGALADAWARFQQKLPRAEQENMRNTPPSLFVLCNAVHAAESRWQSKRDESRWEVVKKTFVKLSRSTEDYSQLLAVVPANDKYISLLTGSLSAVVKHEDIAFAIADILEQLCKDMKYWKKQIMAHPDVQSMQDDVRELYIVKFELLTEIFTEWSSSSIKRFWKSFDKNVANKLFGSRKAAIERLTLELDRAADLDSQERNGLMQQYILNLPTKQDLEGVRLQLGEDIVKLFVAVDASDRFASTASLPESASLALHKSHEDQQISSGKDTALSTQRFKRHDVLRSIPSGERLLRHPLKEVERLRDRASHLEIDRRIVSRLHEWTSNKSKSNTCPRLRRILSPR